ncbi:hypothetical protein HQ545_08660 [Candidatus Woesearchaeota archaeon]|nr:hypothetical protein [Candidatus Woesearchaeota archaeon]
MVRPEKRKIDKLKSEDKELSKLPSIKEEDKRFSRDESFLKKIVSRTKVRLNWKNIKKSRKNIIKAEK